MTDSKAKPANDTKPSFLRRIPLAIGAFFRTFSDVDYAARIDTLRAGQPATVVQPPDQPPAVAPPALKETPPEAALQLLSLLQRDARLIDFAMEELKGYSDAEVGAAARVVHEGCRKVLSEHFDIQPVRQESEGSRITLAEGFDAALVRLTGNVVGKAPFHGSLAHRGWRAAGVTLPKLTASHDATVLMPAEVEL